MMWGSAKARSIPVAGLNGTTETRVRTGNGIAVTPEEAEDVFFNEPVVIRSDVRHSTKEKRYYALGQTGDGRRLFVAFTVRRSLLRVVSVRDMNQREMDAYAKHEEKADS